MGKVREWVCRGRYVMAILGVFVSGAMLAAGAVAVSSDRAIAKATDDHTTELTLLRISIERERAANQEHFEELQRRAAEHQAQLDRLMDLAEAAVGKAIEAVTPP